MLQQINLFKFVKLPIKSALSSQVLLSLYGALVAVLMMISLVSSFHEHSLSNQNDSLKVSLEQSRKNLVAMAGLFPQTNFSSQLIDSTKLPMCNIKFSQYMESFAKAYVQGVWLTQINISNSGKEISLHGNALRVLQVQQYLLELKQIAMFTGFDFQIQDLDDKTPPVSFVMVAKVANHG
jgi:hypothetical protein